MEAPGEMPADQDDPGPLYSWQTGEFKAVDAALVRAAMEQAGEAG